MYIWIRLFVCFLFLSLLGCATNSSNDPGAPRSCPGMPSWGLGKFGYTQADIIVLHDMRLVNAITAVEEQDWERAENLFMQILSIENASGSPVEDWTAHSLVHVLCLQGKFSEASTIATDYNVPY